MTLKKKKEAKMQNTLLELPQEQPLIMAGKRKNKQKIVMNNTIKDASVQMPPATHFTSE